MVTDPRSSPLPSSFYLLRHDLRLELAASKQLALALASDSLPRPTLFEAPQRVDWTLLTQFYLVLTAVSTRSVRSSQARSPSAIVVASSLLALDRNQVFLFHPVRSDSGDLNELHGHCSRPTESFRSQPVSAKSESVSFFCCVGNRMTLTLMSGDWRTGWARGGGWLRCVVAMSRGIEVSGTQWRSGGPNDSPSRPRKPDPAAECRFNRISVAYIAAKTRPSSVPLASVSSSDPNDWTNEEKALETSSGFVHDT